jgi:NAD+ kinase
MAYGRLRSPWAPRPGRGYVRRSIGIVLHPERDPAEAVAAILHWAARENAEVLGLQDEVHRAGSGVVPVTAGDLGRRADLVVSLGGDGTMLRAMRLADRQRAPVLGVDLGKLSFLAEVDVPELPCALSAITAGQFTAEPRLAIDAVLGSRLFTAFNDIVAVRVPGHGMAGVAVHVDGRPFISYAADAPPGRRTRRTT